MRRKTRITSRILVYAFLALILTGTFLLWLPLSASTGESSRFIDALYTATSAVCVTGLVVQQTAEYWSTFGQAVILLLIQLGGFGIMSGVTLIFFGLRRRIGLQQRLLVGQSLGQTRIGGSPELLKKMALFVLLSEAIGALVSFMRLSALYPPGKAAWASLFHSISAFNNAGFDIFGGSSIQAYRDDAVFVLTTAVLIILGGISFVTLDDFYRSRRFNKLSLDSRIILIVTLALLSSGWLITFLVESGNPGTLGPLTLPEKLLASFFHSVTARTAGFTLLDVSLMAVPSLFFTMVLMFIGGVTGSTAGGIKVNTFSLLMAAAWSAMRGQQYVSAFGRTISDVQVRRAFTVTLLSVFVVLGGAFFLSLTEEAGPLPVLFETVSAFGTVGLGTGITSGLSDTGKMIIIFVIFAGRLGPITLAVTLIQRERPSSYREPRGDIRLG